MQMPGAVGQPGTGIRHHGGTRLVAAHGERDGGVVERVEHREIALARHAEDVIDALRHEAVDEDLAARPPVADGVHRTTSRGRCGIACDAAPGGIGQDLGFMLPETGSRPRARGRNPVDHDRRTHAGSGAARGFGIGQ